MKVSIEQILLVASTLLILSVVASKASARLGVPVLVVFLFIGMLAGSDGPGGIYFDDPGLAQSMGVLALAFILFSGGLDTDWAMVRPVLWKGLGLATLGVLITAMAVGGFASAILGLSLLEGLLLGAIVSSTDAAAVLAVMRSKNVSLRGQLKPLLELESGSNDPMAVFLTLGCTRLLSVPDFSTLDMLPFFAQQMALGAAAGLGLGRAMTWLVNRLRLEYEGLYPVLTSSLVLFTYGATAALGGNGFLAVYLAGLVLGNSDFIHKKSLVRFHDGLAWLMQIAMFLTLGLLVFPSRLAGVIPMGLLLAGFLMLVARPVGVLITLLLARMNLREKTMISWVGLRGAVPIILATFPLLSGVPKADLIFNTVFFIVLTSVLLQGTTIPLVAKWLGVDAPMSPRRPRPLEFTPTGDLKGDLVEIVIPANSAVVGKQIVELGLAEGALIVLLDRCDEHIIPSGGTVLQAGDTLLVLADQAALAALRSMVESSSASVAPDR